MAARRVGSPSCGRWRIVARMDELIISVSGLRGIVGRSLTPLVAIRYVAALAAELEAGPLVVSRDGRDSGRMLAAAVTSGLKAAGRDVISVDVAATPTVGVLIRTRRAAGGIQITASHNPAEYNGLKLFGPDGRVINAEAGARVLQRYRADRLQWATHDQLGRLQVDDDPHGPHLDAVLAAVDADAIRKRAYKVLLDANHGAGGRLGPRLLKALGCEVIVQGEESDGQFEHLPEPTAENLAGVLAAVPKVGADIGFCLDPDADRLAIIDADGRYLGEECTLALCVEHVLRGSPGAIVTNCSTSRVSQDLAERAGVPFFRSAVGEANVVDCMLAHDAVLGGEGNGGVIDPRVGLVRDSFIGMALVLEAMSQRELPVGQLADELPQYSIHKAKAPLAAEKLPAAYEALCEHFAAAASDRLDGLRLDWPGRWLLVRPSNTEPIVRIFAEAATAGEAETLCDEAAALLAKC